MRRAHVPAVYVESRFRAASASVRSDLGGADLFLFDLLCMAGRFGRALPYRRANLKLVAGRKDPRRALRRRLARAQRSAGVSFADQAWAPAARRLSRHLARTLTAREADEAFRSLRVLLNNASIALAPDCAVPTHPALRAAWDTVVKLFATLYASGVAPVGPLHWLDKAALAKLRRETRHGQSIGRSASGLRPGIEGRRLAIDPRLMRMVSRALGKTVVPGYEARYVFYSKPGDYFFPHPDDPEYPVNVLVCLDRRLPSYATSGSAFLAYRPDGSMERYEIRPGYAVAAEARGVIHGREPLRKGESTTLLSIAVNYATRRR